MTLAQTREEAASFCRETSDVCAVPSLGELLYLFVPESDSLDSVASGIVNDLPPALEQATEMVSGFWQAEALRSYLQKAVLRTCCLGR